MTRIIRIGIVGSGRIAGADHIPGFLGAKGCRITALCDIRQDRIDAARAKSPALKDAAGFKKDADLFKSGLVDAVAICTPSR